jgi:hypothetical protein
MNGQEAAPPVAIVGLDEDMVFQHREWRWQRVGRVAVAVFVLAACLGLLGGAGPFNRTEARADDDSLIVEYDRVIRAGTPTTVQLNAAAAADYCLISPALFDALDIERIVPAPQEVVREQGSVRLHFTAPVAAGSSVRIDASAPGPGRVRLWAALAGHRPVAFTPVAIF